MCRDGEQESSVREVGKMVFEKGDFIYLDEGPVLEVVYADEEKAVCLILERNKIRAVCEIYSEIVETGCFYTGQSTVISNKEEDYKDSSWMKKGNKPNIEGMFRWSPIRLNKTYNFKKKDEKPIGLNQEVIDEMERFSVRVLKGGESVNMQEIATLPKILEILSGK